MEIIVVLVLLGLCFGSFVNALVWRLHEKSKAQSPILKAQYSIVHGRSMCIHCHHTLAWYDLLPVLSWFALGGKCHYCGKPISILYPVIELFTAALFVISYLSWPYQLSTISYQLLFALWLISVTGFVALAVYDFRWMLLPNKIIFPLIGVASLHAAIVIVMSEDAGRALVAVLLGLLVLPGLFYLLYQVSRGRWIGGGDVKLAFVLGLLVAAPAQSFLVLFLASIMGTIVSVPLMAAGKLQRTSRIPFGPLLLAATFIVYLFGHELVDTATKLMIGA